MNSTNAHATNDSTVVIGVNEQWKNTSAQAYIALPESHARRILAQLYTKEKLDCLYIKEAEKTYTLSQENKKLTEVIWRDRIGLGVLLIFLIVLK